MTVINTATKKTILITAGLDPSGGAGLLADARMAHKYDFHPYGVVTTFTAQGEKGAFQGFPMRPSLLREQVHLLGNNFACWKVGLLGTSEIADEMCQLRNEFDSVPCVLDPVLFSSSGAALYTGSMERLWEFFSLVTLVTPNTLEASTLLNHGISTHGDMREGAREISRRTQRATLIKGGHSTEGPLDVLCTGEGEVSEFPVTAIAGGTSVRGTGCALSTALACELALGRSLKDAVPNAQATLAIHLGRAYSVGGHARYLP